MARSAVRPRARGRIEDHHAEWLSLVETSGPFLTVPALKRALPDGLEATTIMPDLRVAYAEWQSDAGLQRRWVRWVLDELLGLRDAVAEATDADPSHRVAEHGRDPAVVVRRPRSRPGWRPGGAARAPLRAGHRAVTAATRRAVGSHPARPRGRACARSRRAARARHRWRALDARVGARGREHRHVHVAQRAVARGADHAASVRHAARRPPVLRAPGRGGAGGAAGRERGQAAGGRRPARRPGPPRRRAADHDARLRGPRASRRAARGPRAAPRCTAARSP